MKHIVVQGNPIDGFAYFGPFETTDEALSWAEEYASGGDWWIATLNDGLLKD